MSKTNTNGNPPECGVMPKLTVRSIIALGKGNNNKGDIFNEKVYDIFHTLGYYKPIFNLAQPGHETDIILEHRTEKKVAFVETKSGKAKIGGDEVNKFFGSIDIERRMKRDNGKETAAYYVSRAGFKESAIEQERKRGHESIILMGPKAIVEQLIEGRVVCSLERAVAAVKLQEDSVLTLCSDADIICCEYGWLWVLYYSAQPEQEATHFALVHADGNRLLNSLAENVIELGKTAKEEFASLEYLPAPPEPSAEKQVAREAYFDYLAREFGYIRFEGMPTDREAGTVKAELEKLFVPLLFKPLDLFNNSENTPDRFVEPFGIEAILEKPQNAAILAKPGGGKSTLLKRIALAYAFPERKAQVDGDRLPDEPWFPVYIRCRDLENSSGQSIIEIMEGIVRHAELKRYENGFKKLLDEELQQGKLLLLVDGLDEISEEKRRDAFVEQLRRFAATYPLARLVITSREAGFRAVAGSIASYCQSYTIAELNDEQIRALSDKWHEIIMGEADAAGESEKTCTTILKEERILALAKNPLLLTTLLFVKRWLGYLPTKKCQLYAEMIKLLLVTWNAEGHARMDIDETEPQLAYIAYKMTVRGVQTVTKSKLRSWIIEARQQLPELLGYTQVSPTEFIKQVEERSSLLILKGKEENENGLLEDCYEFSHLSFQEYLTAKAVAEAWLPQADGADAVEIIDKHLDEVQWREVIPMIAVLSGRNAKCIMEYLLKKAENDTRMGVILRSRASYHLANCIASEVPMPPEMLDKAILLMAKYRDLSDGILAAILNSKYGSRYRELVRKELFEKPLNKNSFGLMLAWSDISYTERVFLGDSDVCFEDEVEVLQCLESNEREKRVTGATLLGIEWSSNNRYDMPFVERAFSMLADMLDSEDRLENFAAIWVIGIVWRQQISGISASLASRIMKRLAELWMDMPAPEALIWYVPTAIVRISNPQIELNLSEDTAKRVKEIIQAKNDVDNWLAAIVLAKCGKLIPDDELRNMVMEYERTIADNDEVRYRLKLEQVKRLLGMKQ